MQIIIDIDGTICTEERQFSRPMATPLPGAIQSINKLYSEGHTIILYTARTWAEWEITRHWLQTHGVQYHQLFMGKPVGDVWIDDRAIAHNNWEETMDVLSRLDKRK
ncbi:MAG: HAD hydrolase family protein [Bacteroidetes bacterium]|nr:HAD hydrolase family protein [Bacteroidota bacterium]